MESYKPNALFPTLPKSSYCEKNLLKWVWLLVVIVSSTQCITRTRVSVRGYLDSAGLWAGRGREGYHLDETNWGEKTWSLWESHSLCRGFCGCRKQIQCRHACADLLLCALDHVGNVNNCPTSCSVIPHNDGLQSGTVSQANLFPHRLLWSEFYHNQKRNRRQWANERKSSSCVHEIMAHRTQVSHVSVHGSEHWKSHKVGMPCSLHAPDTAVLGPSFRDKFEDYKIGHQVRLSIPCKISPCF